MPARSSLCSGSRRTATDAHPPLASRYAAVRSRPPRATRANRRGARATPWSSRSPVRPTAASGFPTASTPARRRPARSRRLSRASPHDARDLRTALRRGPRADARRRQLAGARVPGGRRRAGLRRARRGRRVVGRRRQRATSTTSLRWGPLILGARPPARRRGASQQACGAGTSFGAPTEREVAAGATLIVARCPSVEMVRFVNRGTEATMSALRLARGVHRARPRSSSSSAATTATPTSLLVQAGSGVATLGTARPPRRARRRRPPTRWSRRYNDLDAVAALFDEDPGADRRRHRRAGRRQHGRRPAGRGLPARAARADRTSTARS